MIRRLPASRIAAWLIATALGLMCLGSAQANSALTRYPTLHGDSVVFEAHGNLWKVSRDGGVATRLTTDPGFDIMPRYSPDGKWIAFTGQYQGNTDVYVIPADGGPAKRLTYHSDVVDTAPERWGPDNMVVNWTPDSKSVVFLSRRSSMNSWFGRYFTVPVAGGAEELMPLDKGGMFTWSPDGDTIAYNRIFRNFRTWKRYTGGLHQNVWTHDFKTGADAQLTDWKGSDIDPMWYGHTVYFASDRDDGHRMNIWALDLDTKQTRQITHFSDYDVDWPSLGDNGIVFQQGGSLYVLDLPSEQVHKLSVDVPDDGSQTNARYVDAAKFIQSNDPGRQHRLRRAAQRQARAADGPRRPVHVARPKRQHPRPDPDLQRQGREPLLVAGRQVDRLPDRHHRRGGDRGPSLGRRCRADHQRLQDRLLLQAGVVGG